MATPPDYTLKLATEYHEAAQPESTSYIDSYITEQRRKKLLYHIESLAPSQDDMAVFAAFSNYRALVNKAIEDLAKDLFDKWEGSRRSSWTTLRQDNLPLYENFIGQAYMQFRRNGWQL